MRDRSEKGQKVLAVKVAKSIQASFSPAIDEALIGCAEQLIKISDMIEEGTMHLIAKWLRKKGSAYGYVADELVEAWNRGEIERPDFFEE